MNEAQKTIINLSISLVGFLLYYLLPIRKKVMRQNIDIVFKQDLSQSEKKRLMIAFYSHAASSIKEMIILRWKGIEQLKSHVEIKGVEHLLQAKDKAKGVLLLTGHLGNFEFAPYIMQAELKTFGVRCSVVRKEIQSKFLENIVSRNCEEAGGSIIQNKGAFMSVRHALAANDAVIFATDQHASNKMGIAVDFFGKKAGTHRSLAILVKRSGAPVIPMGCYRLKSGQHIVEFKKELEWIKDPKAPENAIYNNTLVYNQALESLILAHPEQWLWTHRRWKLPQ